MRVGGTNGKVGFGLVSWPVVWEFSGSEFVQKSREGLGVRGLSGLGVIRVIGLDFKRVCEYFSLIFGTKKLKFLNLKV